MNKYRFFVVSDTHTDTEIMNKCMNHHLNDVTNWFHLGDSELPAEYINERLLGVRGNCDYYAGLPYTRDIVFPFGKVHLEHGNRFDGISDEYIKETGCKIFLSGHTHRKLARKLDNGVWQFNPGSLVRPRDGEFGSYLLIDVDEKGKILHYEFHLIDIDTGDEVKILDESFFTKL